MKSKIHTGDLLQGDVCSCVDCKTSRDARIVRNVKKMAKEFRDAQN